jgi:ABC-type uncharacterized transport system substrate-binding protein
VVVPALRQGLIETGWVEGQNVAIEYRWAEGHYDRLPALAADLVGQKVDLIVAGALAVSPDSFFGSRREQLVALAARFAVPAIFEWREYATVGGLISYGPSGCPSHDQAMLVQQSLLMGENQPRIVALAAQYQLPAIYEFRESVEIGGLVFCGQLRRENFERAAALVDKILKGAKPADLPIEQPIW